MIHTRLAVHRQLTAHSLSLPLGLILKEAGVHSFCTQLFYSNDALLNVRILLFLHYCLGYLIVLFVYSFIYFIIILHYFALNVNLLAIWVICIYLERKKEKEMFHLGDFLILSLLHNDLKTGVVWNLFVHSMAHTLGD